MITEEERVKELAHADRMVLGWEAALVILRGLDADPEVLAKSEQRHREWLATAEVLADPETVRQLNEAQADIDSGNLSLAEELRPLMEARHLSGK